MARQDMVSGNKGNTLETKAGLAALVLSLIFAPGLQAQAPERPSAAASNAASRQLDVATKWIGDSGGANFNLQSEIYNLKAALMPRMIRMPLQNCERAVDLLQQYDPCQFVSQRHDIAELVGVIKQDIGMGARHRAATERAAALAGSKFSIDPVLGEELTDDFAGLGAKRLVAFLDDAPRGGPIASRQVGEKRCIAVEIA